MILTNDFIRGISDFKNGMVNKYAEYVYYLCTGKPIKNSNEDFDIALKGMCNVIETLDKLYKDRARFDVFDKEFDELVEFYNKVRRLTECKNTLDKIDLVINLCEDWTLNYNEYAINLYYDALYGLYKSSAIDAKMLEERSSRLYSLARRSHFYLCRGKGNLERAYKEMLEEIDKPKTLKMERYINQAIEESIAYKDREFEIKFRELDARLASRGLREMSLFN